MTKLIRPILILISILSLTACQKSVSPPEPFLPVPNEAQLRWHKAEYIMFAHFGMKTFYPSDDHMGYGLEDPGKFNPTDFDAGQWVEAAKAGGFKGIVITAKHHDGFCNWQTKTTDHSVKSSPWKEGEGDIIKELSEACHKGGIYFGIYVSIIDKHFENSGSDKYSDYGDYYLAQLTELSTQYGTIDEYWFDGYKADGLKLDYKKIAEMIKENQPDAVVYDSGTMVEFLPDRCISWPGAHGGISPDQNYRVEIDGVMRWYPAEPSIIWQGNWFHNDTPVISLKEMQNYYLTSVGYGVTPLLNLAPNWNGLIDENTVDGVTAFKTWVDKLHNRDLARSEKAKVSAPNFRGGDKAYSPQQVVDGNYETYFATDDKVTDARIEIDLGEVQEVDGFILQEFIDLGQRVDGYSIQCRVDGKWIDVFSGRRIGYKRIILEERASAADIKFPATDAVRLKITNALACPLISTFQVIGAD